MTRVGYSRVSTRDQYPEAQEIRLREAGCERIFTDKGVSGMKASRPAWDECLRYLREGDTLVAVRLDRIGRSITNLCDVVATLERRGIDLAVLDQDIDTTTSSGKFMFHVLAGIAQFERDLISERTIDGLNAARARGRVGGSKPKLTAAQIRRVRQMYEEAGPGGKRRWTVAEIAGTFGVSRPTIYRALEASR